MDVLRAEGEVYFEYQIEDIGGFCHKDNDEIFAIHSCDNWKDVVKKVKSLGMFIFLYDKVKLLKTTKTKAGLNNYVFTKPSTIGFS